ncbi:MAG TPA: FAD-dependent monooxygenase [Polyangiales bacterium]|nr:FAD-dependent monooxygenase [Polyangiales bacterium]
MSDNVTVTKHSVVIAGAGPTGLMLAAELALARVDVAIVERRASPDLIGLRAGGLHMRTLEALDQRGVVERFVSQGQKHQIVPFAQGLLDSSDAATRHNYYLALWQVHIERILAEWIAELKVPIYRGCDVAGFTQDDSGVNVEMSDGRAFQAQYLVGCDGGRSAIRKKAGIDFPGWDASTSYLIAEVELAEEPEWGLRHGDKGINAIAKVAEGKGARMVLQERQLSRGDAPTLSDLREALTAVYGKDFGLLRASYISRFTDMTRQAAAYRDRRVLLAGDAAHVHSPAGGQGLNLGVQDALNLGWKLAQVVHGTAPNSLLDSYHVERHRVGARVLRNTMALTALERGDARALALREMLSDLMRSDGARKQYVAMTSGLDIHYELGEGHLLLGRRMPDLELVTAQGERRVFSFLHGARPLFLCFGEPRRFEVAAWADRVQRVDARYEGAWVLPAIGEVSAPKAVLVRPDGYVAWVSEGSDEGLREALTTWFGPAR